MNDAFAAALLDTTPRCPPGLRAWNGSDPAVRFAVYRNNVIGSLVDALADNVPVVHQLVGDDFFRAMAALFVRSALPRSPVLAHYGAALPDFIAGFAPARSVPYLADMARLEMARRFAYHSADAPPLAADAMAQAMACGDAVGVLRFTLHPSVAVIVSAHAIVSLWGAHQVADGEVPDLSAIDVDQPEAALILRDGVDVLVRRLPVGAATFIDALHCGADLAESAADATAVDADFDLASTLSLLVQHSALTHVHLPDEARS